MIASALFTQRPEAREGDLSRMRSQLVNGMALAELARELSLPEWLRLGAGEQHSGGRERDSILADAFEALIAAVYLDSDYETCQTNVLRWFGSRLANVELQAAVTKDAKTRLQEWAQARQQPLPSYQSTVTGKAHAQTFTVTCRIAGMELMTTATARSRRAAEQAAAKQYLEEINE